VATAIDLLSRIVQLNNERGGGGGAGASPKASADRPT
jgi:hypothetical protein